MALSLTPTGPQVAVSYVLTGPDGTRAVFNDQTDPDYVGILTEISGFDSPEVRESADNLVQFDGGVHGDFFYGRRPITLTGIILNPRDAFTRNQRANQLIRASNAMRQDAVLTWTLDGGVRQQMAVRRQQPLRIDGQWQKTFQLSLVAADPRIYDQVETIASVDAGSPGGQPGVAFPIGWDLVFPVGALSGQLFVDNTGNATTYPIIELTGTIVNPTITNSTTGQQISITYSFRGTNTLIVDTFNRTVKLNTGASRYYTVDFDNTEWWGLQPGTNELRLTVTSSSPPASMLVRYRSAWL